MLDIEFKEIHTVKEEVKMENLRLRLLSAKIEINWRLIKRERLKGKKMFEKGYSHSSDKMLKLNRSYSKHCAAVMRAQREYDRLAASNECASEEKLKQTANSR